MLLKFVVLNHAFAALFVLSMVVFFEVLVNLKRPLSVKLALLLFSFSIAFNSLGTIYCNFTGYNGWILEIPGPTIAFAILAFFSILYHYKIRRSVLVAGLLIILLRVLATFCLMLLDADHWLVRNLVTNEIIIKIILGGAILGSILDLVFKIIQKYKSENIYFKKVRIWSIMIISVSPFIFMGNLMRSENMLENFTSQVMIITTHLFAIIMVLFRPRFLNKASLKYSSGDYLKKSDSSALTNDIFIAAFFDNLYYLNKSASLDHLSKQLIVSPIVLSNFIYSNYGLSYTDLINKQRVEYFIDLMNTGKFGEYTIEALALQSGFGSRHHLYKSFKKFHGGTPSDYIKSVS
jgi:AraC-like DNA-binding protein